MKSELYERLDILQEAELISNSVNEYCKTTVDYILGNYSQLNEEKMAIFVTHLAMASQRVLNGKNENPVDDTILNSLKMEAVYDETMNLINKIIDNDVVCFPKSEIGYLQIHLCNLLKVDKRKEEKNENCNWWNAEE